MVDEGSIAVLWSGKCSGVWQWGWMGFFFFFAAALEVLVD